MVAALVSERGDCPLTDFLMGLRGKLAKQALRMKALLDEVAANGPPHNVEVSHQLDAEIWQFTRGDLRVLWFYDQGRIVICSHGFQKKQRKTPPSEIARARKALKAYRDCASAGTVEIEEESE